jgi:hypothetical protein
MLQSLLRPFDVFSLSPEISIPSPFRIPSSVPGHLEPILYVEQEPRSEKPWPDQNQESDTSNGNFPLPTRGIATGIA